MTNIINNSKNNPFQLKPSNHEITSPKTKSSIKDTGWRTKGLMISTFIKLSDSMIS